MATIWHILFYSLIGGVVSLIGGFLLLSNKSRAKTLAHYATPFAAGALLAAAFVDLFPESAHAGNIEHGLLGGLFGILGFFLLERFLRVFHHHHSHKDEADPDRWLIIIGDTVHNAIDGVAIAAGFLVNVPTGIVVTLAVAAHEIPQEIGDFGLLLKKGMSRKSVVVANIFSALATTVTAVIFFSLGQGFELPLDIILGLVAGFFIYIATSDIIPSIHESETKLIAGPQTLLLVLGVLVVGITTTYLHQFIDTEHTSETTEQHDNEH